MDPSLSFFENLSQGLISILILRSFHKVLYENFSLFFIKLFAPKREFWLNHMFVFEKILLTKLIILSFHVLDIFRLILHIIFKWFSELSFFSWFKILFNIRNAFTSFLELNFIRQSQIFLSFEFFDLNHQGWHFLTIRFFLYEEFDCSFLQTDKSRLFININIIFKFASNLLLNAILARIHQDFLLSIRYEP